MPTPNFKLLLNALRLGQPQDPKAAVFVLAEALAKQEEAIDELKRRLSVVQSHANLMEAKSLRLEGELAEVRSSPASVAPASMRPAHPSTRPQPGSERPPSSSAPEDLPRYDMAAPAAPKFDASFSDSYDDDESSMHTVVVRQQEVMALRSPEAPFQIAGPSDAPRMPQPSIPGAPWARNNAAQPAAPMEDFTVDAVDSDLDGETYRDRGEGGRRAPRPTPPMHQDDPARRPKR